MGNDAEQKAVPSKEASEGRREVEAPLGTMAIVLVYGVGTIVLWGYLYYIMLKAGGLLGGF